MTDFLHPFSNHHILGIGSDICDIRRIKTIYERFGNVFLEKTYAPAEQEKFHSLTELKKVPFLAKRFAAKEAIVKALGTGFGASANMCDITTLSDPDTGKPFVTLAGKALQTAKALAHNQEFQIFISLSDENDFAQAFSVFALVTQNNQE